MQIRGGRGRERSLKVKGDDIWWGMCVSGLSSSNWLSIPWFLIPGTAYC